MTSPLDISAALLSAPGLDPRSTVSAGLAAGSPHEAVGNATALAGFGTAVNQVDTLHKMSWSQQRTVFEGATKDQQAQWTSAGYRPPPDPQSGGGGFFGSLFHDVAHIAGDVVGGPERLAVGAGKEALDIAGAGLRSAQHLFRAAHDVSEMGIQGAEGAAGLRNAAGGGFNFDPNAFRDIFSPSAWSRAWRETANGETFFDPALERQIRSQYDPTTFKLAKQMASKIPENEIVASYNPALRGQVARMMVSPEVKRAAMQLDNAHVSVGQSLVGEKFLSDHPALGHKISGGVDLAYDIAADPFLKTGKLLGAGGEYAAARYGLSNAEVGKYLASDTTGYQAVLRSPGVQSYVQRIGDIIERHGIAAAERFDPRLLKYSNQFAAGDKVYNGLAEAGVHDAESFGDYLASEAGKAAVLSGRAATMTHGGLIMAHLSPLGWARMAAKGHLAQSIDWAAENVKKLPAEPLTHEDLSADATSAMQMANDAIKTVPHTLSVIANPDATPFEARVGSPFLRPIGSMARLVRQMTTITADAPAVDVTAENAAVNVKRVLSYALPAHQVNQITDAFIHAPDVGTRFAIYKGGVAQMLHYAGAYSTPKGSEAADQILSVLDSHLKSEVYAPGGYDKYADGTRSAVLDNQMSKTLALPSFKAVRQAARRERFYNGLGITNPDTMDKMMERWKQAVLMRPGFAIRVSTDEALRNALGNGLMPYLVSRRALAEAKTLAQERKATGAIDRSLLGKDEIDRKLFSAVASITAHVPSQLLALAKTPADLARAAYGHSAWLAYKATGGKLTREDLMQAAGEIDDLQMAGRSFHDHISSLAHAGGGYDEAADMTNLWVDGHPVPLRLRTGGRWAETPNTAEGFRQKWQMALEQLATSRIGQEALKNIRAPLDTQVRAVKDLIGSDELAPVRAMAKRNNVLGDNRVVGVDATQDEAHTEWAHKAVAMTHHLVRSADPENGAILDDLVGKMVRTGHAPSIESLSEVKNSALPDSVFAPEYTPIGSVDHLVQTGFNQLSRIIDWMSRKPIFTIHYAQAKRDLAPFVREMVGTDSGDAYDRMLSDMATHRAFEAVKPYIHNPEVRSQFEVAHRVAFPFLFAQDQFVKRWARTFVDNPAAIRKAQLAMNGLRVSGIIRRDANGNDVFTYPASAMVTKVISDTLSKMGLSSAIPVGVPFTGEVKNFMPGLKNPLSPSVGPAVAVPFKALADHFPELQPTEQALLAEGASQTWWEQILPTTLNRVIQAVSGNANTKTEFSSSMMKAIQLLYENGQGLAPNATTAQKQRFIDRVTATTRIVFFTKAALGFVAPASPSPDFDPKNLNPRLRTLLGELPYDQALAEFLREHPDASAYSVFTSSSTGDVPNLASTQAAGAFIDQNRSFIAAFPQAAGWFIPRTLGNQPFDPAVYRQQMQYAMRSEKLPAQFLDDVAKAPAANVYYTSVKNEQDALAETRGSAAKSAIRASFDQWKAAFMTQNPALADYLTQGANAPKRVSTIREIETALASDSVPPGPQTEHIRTLLASWQNYERFYLSTQGNHSSSAFDRASQAKASFTAWATQFVKDNPDVADLWNVLLQPEMGTGALTGGLA